jgi:hypothetical protein
MKRGFFRSKESQELVPMTGPAVAEEATPMGPNPGEDLLPVVDRLTMYGDAVANKIDVHCWRNAEGVIVFEAPLPIGEDPHELFETNRSITTPVMLARYPWMNLSHSRSYLLPTLRQLSMDNPPKLLYNQPC